MIRFQFTLRQFSVAVAVVSITLAIWIHYPEEVMGPLYVTILVASTVWITYRISQLPYRIRLTIEMLTLLALVVLRVADRQPPHLVVQAGRAAEAARFASECAQAAESPGVQINFRRKARLFSHRAFDLRCKAIWYSLIGGWSGQDSFGALSQRELIRELELARAIEILKEEAASQP
jgi:hypothetical protein